ncbi:MAG: putative transcriptional regulator [Firmicutes bacterium]|nr:putative transcriptional regulator [Bacillota bacterium]
MENVGNVLRTERENKGLTIKDVEKGTSIRALYIQAIEEGNYEVLPGEVYLKGFLRNYATFLGLDAQEMLNMYRQSQTPPPPPAPAAPPAPKAKEEAQVPQEGQRSFGRLPLVVLGVIVLGAVAWGAVSFMDRSAPSEPKTQVQPAPSPTGQVAPTQPPATVQPTIPPAPAPVQPGTEGKSVVVTANFVDKCWTLVSVDGKEVYQGTPGVGETLTWSGDRDIVIKFGNAGGAEITYNGQAQGKAGNGGEVLIKTFSATAVTNKKQ